MVKTGVASSIHVQGQNRVKYTDQTATVDHTLPAVLNLILGFKNALAVQSLFVVSFLRSTAHSK